MLPAASGIRGDGTHGTHVNCTAPRTGVVLPFRHGSARSATTGFDLKRRNRTRSTGNSTHQESHKRPDRDPPAQGGQHASTCASSAATSNALQPQGNLQAAHGVSSSSPAVNCLSAEGLLPIADGANKEQSYGGSSVVTACSVSDLGPTPVQQPELLAGMVRLHFTVPSFATHPGQKVAIVGACPGLGKWKPSQGLALQWHEGHRWSGELLAKAEEVDNTEFKVVMVDESTATMMWEHGRNRKLKVVTKQPGSRQEVLCDWGDEDSHLQQQHHQQQQQEPAAILSASPGLRARVQLVVPLYVGGPGQRLVVVGSAPELGAWSVDRALHLECSPGHIWRGEVELPLGALMECKLVVLGPGSERRWEAGPNRTLALQPPPAEDICPPPSNASPDSPPSGVLGHYVVLCHWGITGCSQTLYRPNEEQEGPGSSDGISTSSAGSRGRSPGKGSSSEDLSDAAVLTMAHFTVPQHVTVPGQHLVLVGSVPALGSWNPSSGVQLKWGPGHSWSAELPLSPKQDIEAKVVYYDRGRYEWEPGPNRMLRLSEVLSGSRPGAEPLFTCYWGHTPTTPVVVVPKRHPRDLPPELQTIEAEILEQQERGSSESGAARIVEVVMGRTTGTEPSEDDALLRFLLFMLANFIQGSPEPQQQQHGQQQPEGSMVAAVTVPPAGADAVAAVYAAQLAEKEKVLRAAKFRNTKLQWELAETRRQYHARMKELADITSDTRLAAAAAAAAGAGGDAVLPPAVSSTEETDGSSRKVPKLPAYIATQQPAVNLQEMGPQTLSLSVSVLVGLVPPPELQELRDLLRADQAANMEFESSVQQAGPAPSSQVKKEVISSELRMVEARDQLRSRLEVILVAGGPAAAALGRVAQTTMVVEESCSTRKPTEASETVVLSKDQNVSAATDGPMDSNSEMVAFPVPGSVAAATAEAHRNVKAALTALESICSQLAALDDEREEAIQAGREVQARTVARITELEAEYKSLQQSSTLASAATASDAINARELGFAQLRADLEAAEKSRASAEVAAAELRSSYEAQLANLQQQIEIERQRYNDAAEERSSDAGSMAKLRAESYVREAALLRQLEQERQSFKEAETRASEQLTESWALTMRLRQELAGALKASRERETELEVQLKEAREQLQLAVSTEEKRQEAISQAAEELHGQISAKEAELSEQLEAAQQQLAFLASEAAAYRVFAETDRTAAAKFIAGLQEQLTATRFGNRAMGTNYEDLAWQLGATLATLDNSEKARTEAEAVLRLEITQLSERIVNLEEQLAAAGRQYEADLLAAEQQAAAAREAAEHEYALRSDAMQAFHSAQMNAAETRVAELNETLQAALMQVHQDEMASAATVYALRQELQAAKAETDALAASSREEVQQLRSELHAVVASKVASLAVTRQQYESELEKQREHLSIEVDDMRKELKEAQTQLEVLTAEAETDRAAALANRTSAAAAVTELGRQLAQAKAGTYALGRSYEDLAWELEAAMKGTAALDSEKIQVEGALNSEVAKLSEHIASLEEQLATAIRQYEADLLAAEQQSAAAREAAETDFAARATAVQAAHSAQIAASESRVAQLAQSLKVTELRSADESTLMAAEAKAAQQRFAEEKAMMAAQLEAVELLLAESRASMAAERKAAELRFAKDRASMAAKLEEAESRSAEAIGNLLGEAQAARLRYAARKTSMAAKADDMLERMHDELQATLADATASAEASRTELDDVRKEMEEVKAASTATLALMQKQFEAQLREQQARLLEEVETKRREIEEARSRLLALGAHSDAERASSAAAMSSLGRKYEDLAWQLGAALAEVAHTNGVNAEAADTASKTKSLLRGEINQLSERIASLEEQLEGASRQHEADLLAAEQQAAAAREAVEKDFGALSVRTQADHNKEMAAAESRVQELVEALRVAEASAANAGEAQKLVTALRQELQDVRADAATSAGAARTALGNVREELAEALQVAERNATSALQAEATLVTLRLELQGARMDAAAAVESSRLALERMVFELDAAKAAAELSLSTRREEYEAKLQEQQARLSEEMAARRQDLTNAESRLARLAAEAASDRANAAEKVFGLEQQLAQAHADGYALGRNYEDLAWQLSHALAEESYAKDSFTGTTQVEAALRSEIAQLVLRAASLEEQLAHANSKYEADLLAVEQLGVAAREAALAAAQEDFVLRMTAMQASHDVQLTAAEARVQEVTAALQAAELRAAAAAESQAASVKSQAELASLRQELQAAHASAAAAAEASHAAMVQLRSELEAAVSSAAATLATTRQQYEARLVEQQTRLLADMQAKQDEAKAAQAVATRLRVEQEALATQRLAELRAELQASAAVREDELRTAHTEEVARISALYDEATARLSEMEAEVSALRAGGDAEAEARAAELAAARTSYEEMATRQQAIADDQLRRELASLAASHAADLTDLDSRHQAQLAERAAAADEVVSALRAEIEALRLELQSRQEMYASLVQDRAALEASTVAVQGRVAELQSMLEAAEARHQHELRQLRSEQAAVAAADLAVATSAAELAMERAVSNARGEQAAVVASLSEQLSETREALQRQQQAAAKQEGAVLAAAAERQEIGERLVAAQAELATAREELQRRLAEAAATLAATRKQYEARLVEQQSRLLEEVALKQDSMVAMQSTVQALQAGGIPIDVTSMSRLFRNELQSRHAEQMSAMRKQYDAKAAAAAAAHAAEVARLEGVVEQTSAQLAAAAAGLSEGVISVPVVSADVGGDGTKAELEAELAELQEEQLAAAGRFHEALETALAGHRMEVEALATKHRAELEAKERAFRELVEDLSSQLREAHHVADMAKAQEQAVYANNARALEAAQQRVDDTNMELQDARRQLQEAQAVAATSHLEVDELQRQVAAAEAARSTQLAEAMARHAAVLADMRAAQATELKVLMQQAATAQAEAEAAVTAREEAEALVAAAQAEADAAADAKAQADAAAAVAHAEAESASTAQALAEAAAAVAQAEAESAATAQALAEAAADAAAARHAEEVAALTLRLKEESRALEEARQLKEAAVAEVEAHGAAALAQLQEQLEMTAAEAAGLAQLLGATTAAHDAQLAEVEARVMEQVKTLERGMAAMEKTVEDLQAQASAAREAEAAAVVEAARLRNELATAQASLAEAEARAATLEAELSLFRTGTVAEAAVSAREAVLVAAHAREVAALQGELTDLRTQSAAQLALLRSALEEARSQAGAAIAEQAAALQRQYESMLSETRADAEARRGADLAAMQRRHEEEVEEIRHGYEAQLADRNRALQQALGMVAALQVQLQQEQSGSNGTGSNGVSNNGAGINGYSSNGTGKNVVDINGYAATTPAGLSAATSAMGSVDIVANNVVPRYVKGSAGDGGALQQAGGSGFGSGPAGGIRPSGSPPSGPSGGQLVGAAAGGASTAGMSTRPAAAPLPVVTPQTPAPQADRRLVAPAAAAAVVAPAKPVPTVPVPPPPPPAPVPPPAPKPNNADRAGGGLLGGLFGLFGGGKQRAKGPDSSTAAPTAAPPTKPVAPSSPAAASPIDPASSALQHPRSVPMADIDGSSDNTTLLAAALYREMLAGRDKARSTGRGSGTAQPASTPDTAGGQSVAAKQLSAAVRHATQRDLLLELDGKATSRGSEVGVAPMSEPKTPRRSVQKHEPSSPGTILPSAQALYAWAAVVSSLPLAVAEAEARKEQERGEDGSA